MTDQPPTEQQLDEIETRANAATPGPWKRSEDYSDVLAPDGSQLASYWLAADGEFIAHAPDDVRVLLAEIRRQRAELAAVHAFLDEQDRAARLFELPTPAWVEAVRAAFAAPAAPLTASHSPAGDRDGETGTEGAAGALSDSGHPIADADNPTQLRWGLDDVLWGDDDSVIVLMSGPDLEPYWLELDPERAAALREDLAGPAEDPAPAEDFTGTQPCGHDERNF